MKELTASIEDFYKSRLWLLKYFLKGSICGDVSKKTRFTSCIRFINSDDIHLYQYVNIEREF